MQLDTIKNQLKDGKLRWHYKAILISMFHHIKQSQLGSTKGGPKHGWSIRDTSRELSMSAASVCNYLKLNAAISRKPELKELSLKKALKKL